MSSKGKGKDKAAPPALTEPDQPLAKEIVPGKLNEIEWQSLLDTSDGVETASELVDEVFEVAYNIVYAHYLEQQAFPYTISQAKHSLLQIIEWQFLTRDEGERDTAQDPSWNQDEEPAPSVVDSWARGMVRQTSPTSLESGMAAEPPLIIRDHLSPAGGNTDSVEQSTQQSRPGTTASKPDSSIGYTLPSANRKKASQRSRPVARHSKARLVALSQPPTITVELASSEEKQPGSRTQSQNSLHSTTPTSSQEDLTTTATSRQLPFPYGMKPVQLTWQKEVSYDPQGRIVDMVKLDATRFPTHLVRPSVHMVQPPSDPLHLRTHQPAKRRVKSLPQHSRGETLTHSQPPAASGHRVTVSKKKIGSLTKRDFEGRSKVQRSTGTELVPRESRRFPELPALPALVDTIDPRPGVTVREAGRTLQGPKAHSHQQGPTSPRANLHQVQPLDSSAVMSEGGSVYVTCK